jgi:hypothetical protein
LPSTLFVVQIYIIDSKTRDIKVKISVSEAKLELIQAISKRKRKDIREAVYRYSNQLLTLLHSFDSLLTALKGDDTTRDTLLIMSNWFLWGVQEVTEIHFFFGKTYNLSGMHNGPSPVLC